MWRWDQGHLQYFQFDAVRKLAVLVMTRDFKTATKDELFEATGLSFAAPNGWSPWRQYSRALRLSLLVTESKGTAVPTALANVLSKPGAVTSDEYLHFLLQTFTDPSPAFQKWDASATFRFPLLFATKYLLAKCATGLQVTTPLQEIIGAYGKTNLTGAEGQEAFLNLLDSPSKYGKLEVKASVRQARESLQVISQISYFHLEKAGITLSLDKSDAIDIFQDLNAIKGKRESNRDAEIIRLAHLFKEGSNQDIFDYPNTILADVIESGFEEGSKVKRTHVTIERNRELRKAFFKSNPGAVCDFCSLDTKASYHWTNGVLDVHHLLPLASGTRVVSTGKRWAKTTLSDLVAICPSCHRAIHRYYGQWMAEQAQEDFLDVAEAKSVYQIAKSLFGGPIYV